MNLVPFSPAFLTDPFRSVTTVFSITQVSSLSVSWTPGLTSLFPAIFKKQRTQNFKHTCYGPRSPVSSLFYPLCCRCSVTGSCPALHDPMDCSTPGSLFFIVSWSLLKLMSIDMSNIYLLKERWISCFHYKGVCIPTCKMWPYNPYIRSSPTWIASKSPGRLIEKSKVCAWGTVRQGGKPRPALLRQRRGDAAKKPWAYNPAGCTKVWPRLEGQAGPARPWLLTSVPSGRPLGPTAPCEQGGHVPVEPRGDPTPFPHAELRPLWKPFPFGTPEALSPHLPIYILRQ